MSLSCLRSSVLASLSPFSLFPPVVVHVLAVHVLVVHVVAVHVLVVHVVAVHVLAVHVLAVHVPVRVRDERVRVARVRVAELDQDVGAARVAVRVGQVAVQVGQVVVQVGQVAQAVVAEQLVEVVQVVVLLLDLVLRCFRVSSVDNWCWTLGFEPSGRRWAGLVLLCCLTSTCIKMDTHSCFTLQTGMKVNNNGHKGKRMLGKEEDL